jgi:hypothetical protein
MQIPINENIGDLTLLKAIDEEINDCHLRDLAVALGKEQIFSLLNSMVQDSNFTVDFAFNNITYELQKNDYTDLFLPDHKLSFKKPLNPFIRMKLIKALKELLKFIRLRLIPERFILRFMEMRVPLLTRLMKFNTQLIRS